jgi:hypothetical protein
MQLRTSKQAYFYSSPCERHHLQKYGRFITICCQCMRQVLDKRATMAIEEFHPKCLPHISHQSRHQCESKVVDIKGAREVINAIWIQQKQ